MSTADAVRARLAQIGEQVDALDEQLANDHDSDAPCPDVCSTGSTAADAARALLAAVNAVLDLHQPYDEFTLLCEECTEANGVGWPCATYQAVVAALEVTE